MRSCTARQWLTCREAKPPLLLLLLLLLLLCLLGGLWQLCLTAPLMSAICHIAQRSESRRER